MLASTHLSRGLQREDPSHRKGDQVTVSSGPVTLEKAFILRHSFITRRRLPIYSFNHNLTAGSCCGPKKLEAGHGAGRSLYFNFIMWFTVDARPGRRVALGLDLGQDL